MAVTGGGHPPVGRPDPRSPDTDQNGQNRPHKQEEPHDPEKDVEELVVGIVGQGERDRRRGSGEGQGGWQERRSSRGESRGGRGRGREGGR